MKKRAGYDPIQKLKRFVYEHGIRMLFLCKMHHSVPVGKNIDQSNTRGSTIHSMRAKSLGLP